LRWKNPVLERPLSTEAETMTPEQRAEKLWKESPALKLPESIAAAIRAAVAEEREACARIVEKEGKHFVSGLQSTAAAIRARGDAP
jgi:hypothetical protein